MAISSVLDTVSAVETLAVQVDAVLSVASAVEITDADAQALRAGLGGIRADGRALLRALDRTQEEDLAVVDDGTVLITLWRWRRTTRRDVMALLGTARTIQDLAADLVTGDRRKVVVSHEGDTLQRIAARELGDWREWGRLLQANPGVPAGALPSGTTLVIPARR